MADAGVVTELAGGHGQAMTVDCCFSVGPCEKSSLLFRYITSSVMSFSDFIMDNDTSVEG